VIRDPAGPGPFNREQATMIVSGILVFVALIVVLQLWLLTATMDALLGGDFGVLAPAAWASLGCFALNLGLLRYVYRLDR
jgi:divalent metal cation (Fe/Co/Zn/Cd) transporter